MRDRTMFTDKGEELKAYIVQSYQDKQHSLAHLEITAYVKMKNSRLRPFIYAGYLSSYFKPHYSYNEFDMACKNIRSGDLPLKEIDEEDFVGVPYSYLGLIHTMYEQQRKGVGTTLLQLQDYFFAKYCDENKYVDYKEHDKQPMIRGLFYPSEEINRNAAADFYFKNGYSFIKSSNDLYKPIDVEQTLASADKKIMKHLYFKEQEEDIFTYHYER